MNEQQEAEEPSDQELTDEIRIGISSCLLGQQVRYDGGHKRDAFLTKILSDYVTFVPVCPEVESGMTTPRPALRLVSGDGDQDGPRMISSDGDRDVTDVMRQYAEARLARLSSDDLCGYILKSKSPSCGMERVKVYRKNGMPTKDGSGIFAAALLERFPDLPVEEEGRLHDPRLRENFLERVFAYHRLRSIFGRDWRAHDVIQFHRDEKLLLLSHEPEGYRELGRMVARIKEVPRDEFVAAYRRRFMAAMKIHASRGRNTNTLMHMIGYLRDDMEAGDKQELLAVIEDYRNGLVPLVVPITLIRHHVRRVGVPYLEEQHYLHPHPKELMLRNHV